MVMPQCDSSNTSCSQAAGQPRLAYDSMKLGGSRPSLRGGYADHGLLSWCGVSIMGSDVHIRAMWVRAPDDQPAACICSACLICCSPTRQNSLIDPDIHWTHITISPHSQERKRTRREGSSLSEIFKRFKCSGCWWKRCNSFVRCWIIS